MITDTFLNEITKYITGETTVAPGYVAFSEDAIIPDAADTSLPSELDRSSVIASRTGNSASFTSIRSSATATPTTGDFINSLGLFSSSTGGLLFAEATVPNINHTTAFDFEVEWQVTIERK